MVKVHLVIRGQVLQLKTNFKDLKVIISKRVQPIVNTILKFFNPRVYYLLDTCATFYFMKPYVSMRFNVLQDVLLDHFYISTPIYESTRAKGIHRNYPVS